MIHYVLTRSAYGSSSWDPHANRRRLAITAAVTARSLAAQTVDFTWVVLLDASDPLLKERLKLYRDAVPNFLPIVSARPALPRVGGMAQARQRSAAADYQTAWRQDIPSDCQVLLTRLDDDDAFTRDALARYQAAAAGLTKRTALMLPVGVHLWNHKYAVVRHDRNAMHTLVTPPGDTTCVYDYGHTLVRRTVPVITVDEQPGWLWLRHLDTISNARNPAHWAKHPPARLTPGIKALFPIDWRIL